MRELFHEADLCVVGGGLAGTIAAVSAARHGMKVVLMQDRPMLGGNASSEIRMWVCGASVQNPDYRESGILEEITLENFYRNPTSNYQIWDTVIYETAYCEKNITLLLNCTCQTAEMNGNRIGSVRGWQMTSETYHTVKAAYFADCSGDSILAPLTGATFRVGREGRDEFGESFAPEKPDLCTMGLSCMFQIRETTEKSTFIPPDWAYKYETDEQFLYRSHKIGTNYWWIEIGGDRDSIHDTDDLRHELLKIAYGVWDHCKNHSGHEYDYWTLEWIGFLPGKRESRRYVGDHIVTERDVLSGGKFDDVVAYGGWTMDDHTPGGFLATNEKPTIHHACPAPWGFPWRSLYSVNIENLLFAGRNVSTTHSALSSSRVMATCAILGQAVGTAAAQMVTTGETPRTLDVPKLQQTLLYDDCYIPNVSRRFTPLTEKAKTNAPAAKNGVDRAFGEELNCWTGKAGDFIEYSFDTPENVRKLRLVFDSDFRRTYHNMPSIYPLGRSEYVLPKTLVRDFDVRITHANGKTDTIPVRGNRRRLLCLDLSEKGENVLSVRIVPIRTWGDASENAEIFRIFSLDLI